MYGVYRFDVGVVVNVVGSSGYLVVWCGVLCQGWIGYIVYIIIFDCVYESLVFVDFINVYVIFK